MPSILLSALGAIVIAMAIWGLMSGRVVAGARGLRPNYYTRQHHPALYYGFIFVYLLIGTFVLISST